MNLPATVSRYFWGDDLNDLSTTKHKRYIIQTILDKGNITSLHWLFKTYKMSEIKEVLPKLKLGIKSKKYWTEYFKQR